MKYIKIKSESSVIETLPFHSQYGDILDLSDFAVYSSSCETIVVSQLTLVPSAANPTSTSEPLGCRS